MKKIDGLRKKVGQLFQLGLNGTALTDEQKVLFEKYPPGALRVTPFVARFIPQSSFEPTTPVTNIALSTMFAEASSIIYNAAGTPPIIRDGMEGGEWNCLVQDRFPVAPMFMGYGNNDNPAFTYRAMSALARTESAMGLRCSDIMVEVNFDKRNPAIGIRSIGSDVDHITLHAKAMIGALRDHGVIPVIKHFPCQSYGDTDTHFKTMRVDLTKEELEKTALYPYRQLLNDNVMVMLSHAMIPAVDNEWPTTLSHKVVTGLLREEMGFNGVIMTDSITMASILDHFPIPEACVRSILAGADQILLKAEDYFGSAIESVENAVRDGVISEARLDASVDRISRLKNEYCINYPYINSADTIESALHSPQSQSLWKEIGCTVTRVIRDQKNVLPLKPEPNERWLIIENDEDFLKRYCNDEWHHSNILANALKYRFPEISITGRIAPSTDNADDCIEAVSGARRYDRVIIGAYSYRLKHQVLGVSRALERMGVSHLAVINNPFNADHGRLSQLAETVICPFGFFRPSILGAVAMIAGDIPINMQMRDDLAK